MGPIDELPCYLGAEGGRAFASRGGRRENRGIGCVWRGVEGELMRSLRRGFFGYLQVPHRTTQPALKVANRKPMQVYHVTIAMLNLPCKALLIMNSTKVTLPY
jgi:hypothetical protein